MVSSFLMKLFNDKLAPQLWHLKLVLFFTTYIYPRHLFLFFCESPQIGQRKLYRSGLTFLNFCRRDDINPTYLESIRSITTGHFCLSIITCCGSAVKKKGASLLPAPMRSAATIRTPPICHLNLENDFISSCILSILP